MPPEQPSDRLTLFLDQTPDPVAIIDCGGQIRYVNDAWKSFGADNGYHGASFVGQNYFDHCRVEDGAEAVHAGKVLDGLTALARGDIPMFTHVYPAHGPRERRWYRMVANRIGDELIIHHRALVCEHSDLNSEAQELPEYLNAERDAQIAHDVKTALNGLLGYVQLSRGLLTQNKTVPQVDEYLETAEQAGWRISKFLEGMLHRARVRRPDAAAPEPEEAAPQMSVDLKQIVDTTFTLTSPTAPDIAFDLDNRLDGRTALLADEQTVERILLNLVSNAAKYGKEYGRVTVKLDRNESGGIRVTVADDGIGIPGRLLPHVFDKYSRDPDIAGKVNGTGLGLANVKELVDDMDGVILITSEVDKGTTVTVQFPAWRTSRVENQPRAMNA